MGHPIADMEIPRNIFRLYSDLSWLWPMWEDHAIDYAPYNEYVVQLIAKYSARSVNSLLDISCGGGKNIFHLKRHYQVTGLDLSSDMLKLATKLNPEATFVQADMRAYSLGKTFDAILVDDGVNHLITKEDLGQTLSNAYKHLNQGGVLILTPDATEETFHLVEGSISPACKKYQPQGMDIVFVEHSFDPDPGQTFYESAMVYLIRENGKIRLECESFTLGLFSISTWEELFTQAGFAFHREAYQEKHNEYLTFVGVKAPK